MNEEHKKPKITPETFPKAQKVSVLAGLPEYLMEPDNYVKVRKMLYDILGSTCGHSEATEWATCAKCQIKVRDHADAIRKLGFTSPAQYYAWRKVHEVIEEHKLIKLR